MPVAPLTPDRQAGGNRGRLLCGFRTPAQPWERAVCRPAAGFRSSMLCWIALRRCPSFAFNRSRSLGRAVFALGPNCPSAKGRSRLPQGQRQRIVNGKGRDAGSRRRPSQQRTSAARLAPGPLACSSGARDLHQGKAEREGFEPSVTLLPHRFSRPAQSATLSPLRRFVRATRTGGAKPVPDRVEEYSSSPPPARQRRCGASSQAAACIRPAVG